MPRALFWRKERLADGAPGDASSFPLLAGLDETRRAAVDAELEWLGLPGGRVLFQEGEPADAMFLLLSGALGVVRGSPGTERLVARIHAGESVGEMALLSDRPRPAGVVALRDCILARLSRPAFERVVMRDPALLRLLGAHVVNQLDQPASRAPVRLATHTLAVIPLHAGPRTAAFAPALCEALAGQGRRVYRFDDAATGRSADVLHAVEAAHDLTVYQGTGTGGAWDALCARRADRVLLVAEAGAPLPGHATQDPPWRVRELVLLQDGGATVPIPAEPWLQRLGIATHFHLRSGSAPDLARLARHLTGEALGLVFSGGGARGYGHIGVVKALREAGVTIDLVGGTSFGAIVAAAVAAEWDDAEMRARFHDAFARSSPVRDYAWPAVALTKGREVTRRFRQHFGDRRIEDLWRPCFAAACNLSQGTLVAQRRGPIWAALRASVAVPGLLPPWIVDGELLVDGGLLNNLPVDVMAGMEPGAIIAVDVAPWGEGRPALERRSSWLRRAFVGREFDGGGIASVLLATGMVASAAHARNGRGQAHLLLEPPLPDVPLLDWKALDRAVEAGYRYAMDRIDAVRSLRRGPDG